MPVATENRPGDPRLRAPLADLSHMFAARMAQLGPFGPAPRLAAGVSGGADSLALALLADDWARSRGGMLLALIVDHGLRPAAAAEAAVTAELLAARGISARTLRAENLLPGPGLAERARAARFHLLAASCAAAGITDLLVAHHAADQAETVLIRALSASGPAGLAGMAALRETEKIRLLRPLLGIPPVRLRDFLRAAGLEWVEDPSNIDVHALRPRLRALRADRAGDGPATFALLAAAQAAGKTRATAEAASAAWLAEHVDMNPEGFALLPPEDLRADALASLIQTFSGAPFPPPAAPVASLVARPRPATLAGTRLLRAGRLGPGWLLTREASAMAPQVAARPGAVWDGRFRLHDAATPPTDATLGPLGPDAAGLRHLTSLPAAVLVTLPAIRCGKTLFAVPHLGYPDADCCARTEIWFSPLHPVAGAPFAFAVG